MESKKPFIWRAKYQGQNIDEKKIEEEARRKAEENKIELEKIKERREKRELEIQQKINDSEFLQRQKEANEYDEQQEEEYLLRQNWQRSKIRIRDGRAKTIDLLAHYIDVFGTKRKDSEETIDLSDISVELLNPCDWFNGLCQADLEALEPDIRIYMRADCRDNHQYWRDLLSITRNELVKLQAVKGDPKSSSDINPAILNDVVSMFNGKTIPELDDMEKEMAQILDDQDPAIDANFFQSSLMRLRAYRAKLRLTMNHEKNLETQKDKILPDPVDTIEEVKIDTEQVIQSEIDEYEEGCYTPTKFTKDELDSSILFTDYEKEYQLLVYQRNQIANASSLDDIKRATMTGEERAFIEAASKGMNNKEESMFSCESAVKGNYSWADKYQPRKPRYFNRVHTGFEWNKYNQTHYDIDNPPPKVVQGYKFNIFYPDLMDKSKTPTFTLTPCPDNKDFCTIRFSAGPPYEDIAFQIVNREWNNSHKSGYRCQFISNVLQLWFQFKRYRYRR